MSFISIAAHQKFIFQCNRLIADALEHDPIITKDETIERLKSDLAKLQQLTESYMNAFSHLSELSREYNTLQRHVRVNMRKMQIERSATIKNSKS